MPGHHSGLQGTGPGPPWGDRLGRRSLSGAREPAGPRFAGRHPGLPPPGPAAGLRLADLDHGRLGDAHATAARQCPSSGGSDACGPPRVLPWTRVKLRSLGRWSFKLGRSADRAESSQRGDSPTPRPGRGEVSVRLQVGVLTGPRPAPLTGLGRAGLGRATRKTPPPEPRAGGRGRPGCEASEDEKCKGP